MSASDKKRSPADF
jgi:small nuclear ribonucleoprotein (snRNP)-like protein